MRMNGSHFAIGLLSSEKSFQREVFILLNTEVDDLGYRICQDLQDKFYGELDWSCQVGFFKDFRIGSFQLWLIRMSSQ